MTDIDDTLLDNSDYQAWLVRENKAYPAGWQEWVDQGAAKPLPGTLDFLNHAAKKGVEIFYITNRTSVEKDGTLKNLKAFNFPLPDEKHLMLRETTTSKTPRRAAIQKDHDVLLLLGDNLADFDQVFEGEPTIQARQDGLDRFRSSWGKKFMILPNPMYGDWEAALYRLNFKLTPEEKDQLRRKALRAF